MKKRRGSLTLEEHDALLKSEGRYEAVKEVQRRLEEEHQKKVAELRRAEVPLVEDLNRLGGVTVTSVWNLVNTKTPYPAANRYF